MNIAKLWKNWVLENNQKKRLGFYRTQICKNMQGRHTSINVQFSGTQECMIYFCGSNNFGDISKYFWHLPFWSPCTNVFDHKKWPENIILSQLSIYSLISCIHLIDDRCDIRYIISEAGVLSTKNSIFIKCEFIYLKGILKKFKLP